MSFPATQLPSPITHCRLEPKVQQAVPARSHFPPLWLSLDWGSAAAAATAAAAVAAASPAPVDCITGCCREAWGAAAERGSSCAWIRRTGGQLCCPLLWGRAARPHLVPWGQGVQCRSWATIPLAGGGARFGGGGGG